MSDVTEGVSIKMFRLPMVAQHDNVEGYVRRMLELGKDVSTPDGRST